MEDLLDTWLSLNEYSNKYQVSLSTLRRRIKSDRVEFEFRYGKYFLKDVSLQGPTPRSSPNTQQPSVLKPKNTEELTNQTAVVQQEAILSQADLSAYSFFNVDKNGASMTTEADQALTSHSGRESQIDLQLSPLQADYELIIQKQKTQIVRLQAELADLKTLVMVLEK